MKATLALMRIAAAWVSVLGACDDDDDEPVLIGGPVELCFVRTDLVSNIDVADVRTDRTLVDPRGLTAALNVFTIVSADTLQAYNADGSIPFSKLPTRQPLAGGYTSSAVRDNTLFLASEQGVISTIDVDNEPTLLQPFVDRSASGASYSGIATLDKLVLAVNASAARIDVFDRSGQLLASPVFVDPSIPAGFVPFNVAVLDGAVFVTYAQVNGNHGYVSAFSSEGMLLWTSSSDAFDGPWGMAIAPKDFGELRGTLLVANHGTGVIDVLDRATGEVLGPLPTVVDGIWGIATGFGVGGSLLDAIYFTAGPAQGAAGVYGVIALEICL